jgi:hypothetical protein
MATFLQAATTPHVLHALRPEAIPHKLRSNHIIIWWQHCYHGKVLCHGSKECGSDLVLVGEGILRPSGEMHLP